MIEKHFVTFVSPGTFVPETNERVIDSWDIEQAKVMAVEIIQRHNARPYSFFFTTMANDGTELNAKETNRSPHYYLGGTILTLADVKARNDPKDKTLIWNMEHNDMPRIVENRNSWLATLPLGKDDVVLDFIMPPVPAETE